MRKTFDNHNESKKLSTASKIVLQINAKLGGALWEIKLTHPYWSKKSIISGGIAFSKGQGSFTMGFVGTYSKDLTKVYSNWKTNIQKK